MILNRNPKGRINYPKNRDRVSRHFLAEGTIDRLPAGQHLLLVVEINGLMWPKGEVQLNNTSWTFEVYEGGTPPDGKFNLGLYLVASQQWKQIAAWLKYGQQTGDYPGLGQINGGIRLHRVRLRLRL